MIFLCIFFVAGWCFYSKDLIFAAGKQLQFDGMLERLRYGLILLLFALVGYLGNARIPAGEAPVLSVLGESVEKHLPDSVYDCLSAPVCVCSVSESSVFQNDSKSCVRLSGDTRSAAAAALNIGLGSRTHTRMLSADPVDYYIYSLGRIRI